MIETLSIIGVGLIGSSLSLALKQAGIVGRVVGYGRNRENLEKGVELGVLDGFEASIEAAVADADVVVVAVPLGAMQAVFGELANSIKKDAVVTDVGSSKGAVVTAAQAELGDKLKRFVPGHPIAGNEKSGVEAGGIVARISSISTSSITTRCLRQLRIYPTCSPMRWCTTCRT